MTRVHPDPDSSQSHCINSAAVPSHDNAIVGNFINSAWVEIPEGIGRNLQFQLQLFGLGSLVKRHIRLKDILLGTVFEFYSVAIQDFLDDRRRVEFHVSIGLH